MKGFVMDDERLKNPPVGSSAIPDYFDEMLERIRDIRASERRVYLRVREISLTTNLRSKRPRFFFKPSRTNCILPAPAVLRRNSSTNALTPVNRIWG